MKCTKNIGITNTIDNLKAIKHCIATFLAYIRIYFYFFFVC